MIPTLCSIQLYENQQQDDLINNYYSILILNNLQKTKSLLITLNYSSTLYAPHPPTRNVQPHPPIRWLINGIGMKGKVSFFQTNEDRKTLD